PAAAQARRTGCPGEPNHSKSEGFQPALGRKSTGTYPGYRWSTGPSAGALSMRTTPRNAFILGGLAIALGLTACAPKVTRDDFESEVSQIREEMQTGDRQLSARIDSVDGRINALEQELQSFRSEYNVSVERLQGALKFNVPVHFEFGSAELREIDRPVLERFAG